MSMITLSILSFTLINPYIKKINLYNFFFQANIWRQVSFTTYTQFFPTASLIKNGSLPEDLFKEITWNDN